MHPFVSPTSGKSQLRLVATEGVKGATGKPPCRLRRGDSPCNKNALYVEKSSQTTIKNHPLPADKEESPCFPTKPSTSRWKPCSPK